MKEVDYAALKIGDLVHGVNSIRRVVKITDKSVSFQDLYIAGDNPEYFESMGLKNARLVGSIPWDGQLIVPLKGNEHLFDVGPIRSERKTYIHRGNLRVNQALLLDKPKDQIYTKDFYAR